MSVLTPILHEATVAGVRVRYFRPQAGTPDFPWHVADDLFAALRFPRPVRQHLQRSLRSDHGSTIRTVATSEGIVTLAPHFMAQGAIGAGVDIGCAPYDAETDYAKAGAAALTKLADSLGLGGLERVQYACEAARRGGVL